VAMTKRHRKALVTGAAREGGIGRAIVERLERAGVEVVTLDVEPGCTFTADIVTDRLPELGDIDVLVANAALTTMFGAAHSMRMERWQRDLDVNLTGTLRVVQACLPGMRDRRFGRIVLISSTAAIHGMPAQIAYSTSKAGLLGMMRTLAAENVTLGVTANAVLPGMTASSGMLEVHGEIIDAWLERMPLGKLVAPADIAEAVAFFAVDAPATLTGQQLTVDGGHSLNLLSVTSSATRRAGGARA
jgi:NAD(P)-dependent dehydrogenase (short-subunit alcohol dehydrogenase family)